MSTCKVLSLQVGLAGTPRVRIAATVPALTRTFATVMLGVVIPLTVIPLVTGIVRHIRSGSNPVDDKEIRP